MTRCVNMTRKKKLGEGEQSNNKNAKVTIALSYKIK